MIAYISGKIVASSEGEVVIKTPSGIGYLITVNPGKKYLLNENIEIFTLEIIRENLRSLYGFHLWEDRDWVEKLMKVSGVGPKAAAQIVYQLGYQNLINVISEGDSGSLTAIKGLGAKTAKKIILELKGATTDLNKLEAGQPNKQELSSEFAMDFADTLSGLGYKKGDVVSTITKLKRLGRWDTSNLVETVRAGLEVIGKNK